MRIKSCLIIGAGMAGLMAAHALQAEGISVTLLDKARGVGGRLATRRVGEGVFDHGAQYFTVRDPRLGEFLAAWQAQNITRQWGTGFHTANGEYHENGEPRYIGQQGMTGLAKHLTQGLTIHLNQRAVRLDYEQGWQIQTESGHHFTADALLLTAPVEQSLTLLQSGNYQLPVQHRTALEGVAYDPCYAVMARLEQPTSIPAPGGLWMNGDTLSWMADNFQKGISPAYGVTLHTSPLFTRQHWETDSQEVARQVLQAAQPWLKGEVLEVSVQRWRYSQPITFYPDRCLVLASPAPLALAGDAFQAARVEGAGLSGWAAAEALLKLS